MEKRECDQRNQSIKVKTSSETKENDEIVCYQDQRIILKTEDRETLHLKNAQFAGHISPLTMHQKSASSWWHERVQLEANYTLKI